MQVTLTRSGSVLQESLGKDVTLYLQSRLTVLGGRWSWEMQCQSIYCSDVMHFPADFEGTKGIIHPDDASKVYSALEVLKDTEKIDLAFRIITTYGDVKTISGQDIQLHDQNRTGADFHEYALDQLSQKIFAEKEVEFLEHRQEIIDLSEKLNDQGSWFINKSTGETWYSDNAFRIYGLSPQMLNAHSNTFNEFIHPEDRLGVIDSMEKAFAERIPLFLEYRILHASGSTRVIQQNTKWFYNKKGQAIVAGTLKDVTEDAEAKECFANADAKLAMEHQVLTVSELVNSCGHWLLNLATRKASYSQNCLDIFGIKNKIGFNHFSLLKLVHPDDREIFQEASDQMFREHIVPEISFGIIRPDGRIRYLRQSGVIVIHKGSDLMAIGIIKDVSSEKALTNKVQQVQRTTELLKGNLQLVEDNKPVGCVYWLPNGEVQWSDGFYRLLGYKPGTMEANNAIFQKAVHPQDLKSFKDAITLVQNGQTHPDLFFRVITRQGIRSLKMIFRQSQIESVAVPVALVEDLTSQELSRTKTEEVEVFANTLAASINDAVIVTNTNHEVTNWNLKAEQKIGLKRNEIIDYNLFDVCPHLNEEKYIRQLHSVLEGGEIEFSGAIKGYLSRPHNYFLKPLKSNSGEIIGVLHVVQDVSREMELQQRLSERLHFIEHLIEASVDTIVVLDRNMNYLYWNNNAEDYYAIRKEHLLGKNILDIFPKFRNDPSYGEFRKVLKGETVHLPAVMDTDSEKYVETWLTPIKDENNNVYAVLWVVHDLTKEFNLQEDYRKARGLLDTIHDACFEVNQQGNIVFFNRKAEELFGWTNKDVKGRRLWDILPDQVDSRCHEAVEQALQSRRYAHIELKSLVLNSWISLTATPTDEGCIVLVRLINDVIEARNTLKKDH